MKALVYQGPGKKAVLDRPLPEIKAVTDAIVKIAKTVAAKKIEPARLITHRFALGQILDAYETFAHAAETHALKMLIEA